MFDVRRLAAIQVGLASPEQIRAWSHGEVKNLKPLTTVHKSQKWAVSAVKKSLDQQKTTNAIVVNIRKFVSKVSHVKNVVLRLFLKKYVVREWDILNLPLHVPIFGI